jgi:hypothetical protein
MSTTPKGIKKRSERHLVNCNKTDTIVYSSADFVLERDDGGKLLATTAIFWKSCTVEQMAIPTQILRDTLRGGAISSMDIETAMSQRNYVAKHKKKQNKIVDPSAHFVLSRGEDGKLLAVIKGFWETCTLEQMSVPTQVLRNALKIDGVSLQEIEKVMNARWRTTPEGIIWKNLYAQIPEVRSKINAKNKSEERKLYMKKWIQKKLDIDPDFRFIYRMPSVIGNSFNYFKKTTCLDGCSFENFKKEMLGIIGCTIEEWERHLTSRFVSGMTWENWTKYNPDTHDFSPTYVIDHCFPRAVALKNKSNIPGLFEFLNNYQNLSPLDARFNLLKRDNIILELIHPSCPGYPFADGLIDVKKIYKTVDEFLIAKNCNRSSFPLL